MNATPTELLDLARKVTPAQAQKAAHALGWPAHRGRTQWLTPFRNFYCAAGIDIPDWEALAALECAQRAEGNATHAMYQVSDLGRRVVRLILDTYRAAHPKDWKRVFAYADIEANKASAERVNAAHALLGPICRAAIDFTVFGDVPPLPTGTLAEAVAALGVVDAAPKDEKINPETGAVTYTIRSRPAPRLIAAALAARDWSSSPAGAPADPIVVIPDDEHPGKTAAPNENSDTQRNANRLAFMTQLLESGIFLAHQASVNPGRDAPP